MPKTKYSLFQKSPNTTTLLFDQLKNLRKQRTETKEDVVKAEKEFHLAREEQSKNLHNYNEDNWAKSIKKQKAAMTEKHVLEQKIEKLDKDIMHVTSLIKRGGRSKRKSRKKIRPKKDMVVV